MSKYAVIFDMDGVLADNNPWHIRAWMEFAAKHGRKITPADVTSRFGCTNQDYISFLFERAVGKEEAEQLGEEKEKLYRELYKKEMKPLAGLVSFIESCHASGIRIGLGTSAPASNAWFVLDGFHIRKYFSVVIDASQISKGKPDPEIYLLASAKLGVPAEKCLVFEDSAFGVEAGKRAGMKVAGVLTSHKPEELKKADLLVHDFTGMTGETVIEMLKVNE